MSKWLSACAAAVLLSSPALAQSDKPATSELQQDPVRPGVLGPGVAAVTPSGDVTPGGDSEAKTTGPDANMSKPLNSGAGGMTRPADRGIGSSSSDAYKDDFKKK